MDDIQLTVAVPTRDRRETVLGAVEQLAKQLSEGDELLVVDNGSGDGTCQAMAAWLARHCPGGRVLSEPDGGVSVARNAALRAARSPVVCFVDDDIRPGAGWLEGLRRAWAERGPQVAAIGGPMEPEWLLPRPAWLTDHLLYVLAVLDLGEHALALDQRPGRGYVWGGNMSVRVEPTLAVGGFDPERGSRPAAPFDRGEEEELQRRLAGAGWEVWYEPEAVVRHLVPPERLTQAFFQKFFREQGLLEAARGRPRREGAVTLAGALARRVAFVLLRRPQAAGASFASARAWALLTGPRGPRRTTEAL
jgi:glucosyl-dolichyl phosphate glucuronosyltransferase